MLLDPDEWNRLQKAPNHMLFNLAKDHFESQKFHVLVYSGPRWLKMLSGKIFVYNFNANYCARACTSGNNRRLIHKGGASHGPYLALGKGERCNVRIRGRNLDNAVISVYGVQDERVYPEDSLSASLAPTEMHTPGGECGWGVWRPQNRRGLEPWRGHGEGQEARGGDRVRALAMDRHQMLDKDKK